MRVDRGCLCGACLLAVQLLVGCEEVKETASTSSTIAPPPAVETTGEAATPAVVTPAVPPPIVPPQPPTIGTNSAENTTPAPIDTSNRTVAEVGVGAKGRYGSNDYVSTVVGSYFGIQQRLAFDLAKRGLNDFKTLNGDYPKTHEQYWKEVIEANSISLPELPAGEEYYYDYESAKSTRGEEALFVVQPKR